MSRRLPPTPQTPFLVGEVDHLPFRFGRHMKPDETILEIDMQIHSVGAVVDPDPYDSLVAAWQLQDTTVVQPFKGLVPHGRYVLACTAELSSGRVLIGDMLLIVLPLLRT